MTRLLFFGDIHYTSTPPRGRTSAYSAQILDKLARIAKLAKTLKVDLAVCTGDLFHRKNPPDADVTALIRAFKAFPGGRIASVLGNHDTTKPGDKRGTAYEVLCAAQVVFDFADGPYDCGGGIALLGSPWRPEDTEDALSMYWRAENEIRVSHGMLVKEDREYPFPATYAGDVDGHGLLVNGHNHSPFEVGNVVNLGSICRIGRSESCANAGARRLLYVVVDDTGKISRRFIPLPLIPDEDVFVPEDTPDAEDVASENDRGARLEEFASDVADGVVSTGSTPDELLDAMTGADPAARERARKYLADAKERLSA